MTSTQLPQPPGGDERRGPAASSLISRIHRWGLRNSTAYYVYPPSVWAVMIYVVCIVRVPEPEVGGLLNIPGLDKIVHAVLYAVLSALIVRGAQRDKLPPLDLHLLVFGLCIVFGLVIEVTQMMTPYRAFELADVLADGVGAALGLFAWHRLMMHFGRRTRLYPGLLRPDFKDHPSNKPGRPRAKS